MKIIIYFVTGESTIFSEITNIEEIGTELPPTDRRIVLRRGAEVVGKFFIMNIAGYSKQPEAENRKGN